MKEQPYLYAWVEVKQYNPKFGDAKECKCGHSYYRHFDSYDAYNPIGCKYCHCGEFKEKETQ